MRNDRHRKKQITFSKLDPSGATTVVFLTTTGLTNIEIANAFKSSLVLKPIHQQRKLMVISLETFYPFIFFFVFRFRKVIAFFVTNVNIIASRDNASTRHFINNLLNVSGHIDLWHCYKRSGRNEK